MGRGFLVECSGCHEEFGLFLGVGMALPSVYEATVRDIRTGVYGDEWRDAMASDPLVVVDVGKCLYVCPECGAWEVGPCLSLSVPKDRDRLLATTYGDKTVEELGHVPYMWPLDIDEGFEVLKAMPHACPQCGAGMVEYREDDLEEGRTPRMTCPICGGEVTAGECLVTINWD